MIVSDAEDGEEPLAHCTGCDGLTEEERPEIEGDTAANIPDGGRDVVLQDKGVIVL